MEPDLLRIVREYINEENPGERVILGVQNGDYVVRTERRKADGCWTTHAETWFAMGATPALEGGDAAGMVRTGDIRNA